MPAIPERFPMPPGQRDPLAADPHRGPCMNCGSDADYSEWFQGFICEERFDDPAFASSEEE
jgi:hypothetical protein